MVRSIRELRSASRQLAVDEGFNPRDADLLLSDAIGKPLSWILANDLESIEPEHLANFESWLERRRQREPVQYIRGHCEFYGRDFSVDQRVLIPRPETELLVEHALEGLPTGARVVDVGTGSGCIAITLSLERRDLEVHGIDVSFNALIAARKNGKQLDASVHWLASDMTSSLRGSFDAVVSNPPYVARSEWQGLQTEVREYEPALALSPGEDGLRLIRELLHRSRSMLRPGGRLLLEIGFNQQQELLNEALKAGWKSIRFHDDLAAIPRVVVLS